MIFDLIKDFADVLDAMPSEHPRRRILKLLDEAIHRDAHFIDRHPTTFFQCMWNTCWWYDCEHAALHYEHGESPSDDPERSLSDILVKCRSLKRKITPGFIWLRSHRPPSVPLGTGQFGVLCGHGSFVTSVTIGEDGQQIISGSDDKTVRVWNMFTGSLLTVLEGHSGRVTSVAVSPAGKLIASGSDDKTVRIWDAASGAEVMRLEGHEWAVASVVFSPNGMHLASGSGKSVRVWDVASGAEFLRLDELEWAVASVAFSPDGKHIASGSGVTVRLWDAASGAEVMRLEGHRSTVTSVAFSRDGRRIATGSFDKTVRLWDAASGAELIRLEGHRSIVTSVAFSSDGGRIASGSSDKTVRLWTSDNSTTYAVLRGHEYNVNCIGFSPDGMRVVSGSGIPFTPVLSNQWKADNTVRVWDATCNVQEVTLRGHSGFVSSIAFSTDGRNIASGSGDGSVRLWETASGVEKQVLRGHESAVTCLAFSADGEWVASGSEDKTVRIWEVATGAEIHLLKGHEHEITQLQFIEQNRLASQSGYALLHASVVWVWDLAAGICLDRIPGSIRVEPVPSASHQSRWRPCVHGRDRETAVEDVITGNSLAWFPTPLGNHIAPENVAQTPDGRTFAAGVSNHVYVISLEIDLP